MPAQKAATKTPELHIKHFKTKGTLVLDAFVFLLVEVIFETDPAVEV